MKKTLTENEFKDLRKHLSRIDSAIKTFCESQRFVEHFSALGRYPRRRLNRHGDINLYCDLQMDLDQHGDYFSTFYPTIPYSLVFGAWVDIENCRYSKNFSGFEGLSFVELERDIEKHLLRGLRVLEGWGVDYLKSEGEATFIQMNSTSQP